MEEDQELFGEIGAEDRIRKPERWNRKQWLAVVAGLALMTVGGIVVIGALVLHGLGKIIILCGLPGAGTCALGYSIDRKHWSLRDR